jgi:hypothetical protein
MLISWPPMLAADADQLAADADQLAELAADADQLGRRCWPMLADAGRRC